MRRKFTFFHNRFARLGAVCLLALLLLFPLDAVQAQRGGGRSFGGGSFGGGGSSGSW